MNRQATNMRYERILGGLFHVESPTDGNWFGYCVETVLSDGSPEPHPKIVVSISHHREK
jgi:hypothetical protein